jgi:L-threonylcarbamoyladenylate synthase
MRCIVQAVDAVAPDSAAILRAAQVVRSGGLVAFPTETVYGLGANALASAAVAKIFAAKGRPSTNPLIVHVANIEEAKNLVSSWPARADRLAKQFWPGPLTLVLPKQAHVPDLVTAGGPTIALRIPAHPVALALLNACQLPIAAPSANRSTELSPTTAAHVLGGLADVIDLLLDAGPTTGGLESTVLDVTTDPPRLLRPGLVTVAQLEAILGPVACLPTAEDAARPARAPGQMERHYAPRTPLEVTSNSRARVESLVSQGLRVGWLTHDDFGEVAAVLHIRLPADPVSYAARLYAALHQLDAAGLERMVVEQPPAGDDWLAIRDRLKRAATALQP